MMRESSKVSRLGSVVMMQDQHRGYVTIQTGLGGVELADTLITSGAVLSAMDDVLQHAQHLQDDIVANLPQMMGTAAGQRFQSDWINWYAHYQTWYNEHRGTFSSGVSYLTGETVAELRVQAAAYNDFESRYTSITGHPPTYNPSPQSSQILPTEAWVGIGVGAAVIIAVAVAVTTRSAAKISAPLRGRRR